MSQDPRMMKLRLYHYWRSSSSWRVRWGFQLKGIPFQIVSVNLLDGSNESPEHRERHPQGYVPVLEFLDETDPKKRFLTESLAMLEWAEETVPSPSLLPADSYSRARCRALAELVNSGIHPLQNPSVQEVHSSDADERKKWAQHWIREGLRTYEALVSETRGLYSVGDQVTLADLCLGPQAYNAARYEVDLTPFKTIAAILENLKKTPAYQTSEPDRFKPT